MSLEILLCQYMLLSSRLRVSVPCVWNKRYTIFLIPISRHFWGPCPQPTPELTVDSTWLSQKISARSRNLSEMILKCFTQETESSRQLPQIHHYSSAVQDSGGPSNSGWAALITSGSVLNFPDFLLIICKIKTLRNVWKASAQCLTMKSSVRLSFIRFVWYAL